MNVILASSSPYRRQLLSRLGLRFDVVTPEVDESEWKERIPDPQQLALQLACEKARSVSQSSSKEIVIGSDQVATYDRLILSKPGSREQTLKQLNELSGRTHELITAVCVNCGEYERTLLDVTSLRMRKLSEEEISTYVDLDEPWDCVGGYQIEKHGISLFEEIRCTDMTAIEGLPLLALSRVLREFGLQFPHSD